MPNDEKVILNEKAITVEELEKEKEKVEKLKGVSITEVSPNTYKKRIQE